MSDYINRLFGMLFKIFLKEKKYPRDVRPAAQGMQSQSRYVTPLGSTCHFDCEEFGHPCIKRYCSLPSVQNQVPPARRCPSQASVLQSGTPARPRLYRRNSISVGDTNRACHRRHPPATADSHEEVNPPTAERVLENLDDAQISSHSFKTCSAADECFDNMPSPTDYEKQDFSERLFNPRIQRFPQRGHSFKSATNSSKIPLRRLWTTNFQACPNKEFKKILHQHSKKHVNNKEPAEMTPETEEIGDGPRVGGTYVSNWIAYRHDTNMKFEQAFKTLSKKKFSIGNLIDSTTHTQWMQACRIYMDKDASLFKIFAGGKVVLTCGEYKFFLDQICSTNEMDYWDVLRKMATFADMK